MVKNSAASLLTSVDDLFTTQEERDEAKRETIMEIPLSQISDFPNHPFKVKMDESMPVEELMKIMTLEDAKGYVIPFGHYSGRTLGDICMEKPEAVNWYIESYKGKNNILRAGAQILLNAAG